jgi:hypothetical protein
MLLVLQILEGLLEPSVGVSSGVRPTFWGQQEVQQALTTVTTNTVPVPAKSISETLTAAVYPVGWDADKIVLNLDPVAVAAWRDEQAGVQAMHKIKSGFK